MATLAAQRFSVRTDRSVFKRLGGGCRSQPKVAARNNVVKDDVFDRLGGGYPQNTTTTTKTYPVVCKYWLEGRCVRNPCRFIHPTSSDTTTIIKSKHSWKNPETVKSTNSPPVEQPKVEILNNKEHNQIATKRDLNVSQSQSTDNFTKVENREIENKVNYTHDENLQSWFCGSGLSMLAQLEGHTKAVTGIVCNYELGKLFCASKDNSLRVWDCNTGKCDSVFKFDKECGILVKDGSWMFLGSRDEIKGWNVTYQTEVIIRGYGGQVNAITMSEDTLFAGMEDGTILSWKSTSPTSFCEVPTALKGHSASVLSLIVGAGMLYSGSSDHSIRVWTLDSLECKHVLNGHTSDVTAVICWDRYLLSGSLDKTIKVWGATEDGNIEQIYAHDVDNGVLSFYGWIDAEGKPRLLCSCRESGVHIYDLPSFEEKGRIFSKHDVRAIEVAPEGLFITGDAAGVVRVWKQNGERVSELC